MKIFVIACLISLVLAEDSPTPRSMFFNVETAKLLRGTRFAFTDEVIGYPIDVNSFKISKMNGGPEFNIEVSAWLSTRSRFSWYADQSAFVSVDITNMNCDGQGYYTLSHGKDSTVIYFAVDGCSASVPVAMQMARDSGAPLGKAFRYSFSVFAIKPGTRLRLEDFTIEKLGKSDWEPYTAADFKKMGVYLSTRINQKRSRIAGMIGTRNATCQLHGTWRFLYGHQEEKVRFFVKGCY